MKSSQCSTSSMLDIGSALTKTVSFSREQVVQYCQLTGDHSAIHRELEAAQIRFPGVKDIIVPGSLIQSTVSAFFGTEFPGDGAVGLSFVPERFRSPVCPGDEIKVNFVITRIRGPILEVDIALDNHEGERVTNVKAKVLAPDEAYRSWWLTQQ